jgi:hypothetical protein
LRDQRAHDDDFFRGAAQCWRQVRLVLCGDLRLLADISEVEIGPTAATGASGSG